MKQKIRQENEKSELRKWFAENEVSPDITLSKQDQGREENILVKSRSLMVE